MFGHLQRVLNEFPQVEGVTMSDILGLPNPLRAALIKCNRKRSLALAEMAAEMDLSVDEMRQVGRLLVEKGFCTAEQRESEDDVVYRLRFAGQERKTARQRRREGRQSKSA